MFSESIIQFYSLISRNRKPKAFITDCLNVLSVSRLLVNRTNQTIASVFKPIHIRFYKQHRSVLFWCDAANWFALITFTSSSNKNDVCAPENGKKKVSSYFETFSIILF